jgi:hypothetical protein
MRLTCPLRSGELNQVIPTQYGEVTIREWLQREHKRINRAGRECRMRRLKNPEVMWLEVFGDDLNVAESTTRKV